MFIEKDKKDNNWVLLFRSYAGNGKKFDSALPETDKDEWVKNDPNNVDSKDGAMGGMKAEPSEIDWYEYCDRKKMELPITDNIPVLKKPVNGNQLLDTSWEVTPQGVVPPDVSLDSSGNYWPNTNILDSYKPVSSNTPKSAKYSYPVVSYPIIWRSVTPGSKSSPSFLEVPEWAYNIYYKRITPWKEMDIKDLFLKNFGNHGQTMSGKDKVGNIPDIDFELYSSLDDALEEDFDNTWWDQMTEIEKKTFLRPKNPKRWKIYNQGSAMGGNKKTTLFGDVKKAFPSYLGPLYGNTSKPGTYGISTEVDDIKRQGSTGKSLQEASLDSYANSEFSSYVNDEKGDPVSIQASEWKFYVLGRELGCVLDFDSQRSSGVPLTNTKYVNMTNIKDHLKCTYEKPVCQNYKPWSGDINFDLSTIHAAGPTQKWGVCRGFSVNEKEELKKKAMFETTAQRMMDMQDLKVKPNTSLRDPNTMNNIENISDAQRKIANNNKIRITNVDADKKEDNGKFFNFDMNQLEEILNEEVENGSIIEIDHLRYGKIIGTYEVVVYKKLNKDKSGDAYGELNENSEPDFWMIGDIIIPKKEDENENTGITGLGGPLQNTRFAQAAFKNLRARYEARLGQLQDQDKVLRLQMEEIKKKNDKTLALKYKLDKERVEINRNSRSITLSQEYDKKRLLKYNILTSIAGVSSVIILSYIVKQSFK